MFLAFHICAICIYVAVFGFIIFKEVRDMKADKSGATHDIPSNGMVLLLLGIGLIPIINLLVLCLFSFEFFLKDWLAKPIATRKKNDD